MDELIDPRLIYFDEMLGLAEIEECTTYGT
jgi:hypothetical protein